MDKFTGMVAGALLLSSIMIAAPVCAATVSQPVNTDLTNAPYSFTFEGSTFTFSSTGDGFNPLAVQTSGGGEVTAFGGFLGIPISPTSDFVNRGFVSYGPGQYADFSTATTIPYSNGDNFIGLEANNNGQTYYGFAYTTDTQFNGFAYNTVAGAPITALTSVSSAPEPGTWALMFGGIAMIGGMLRIAFAGSREKKVVFSTTGERIA